MSSAAYAAIPAWAASTAYTVGQIVRPTAAAFAAQYPQRCTTAGTSAASEPSWSLTNNATTVSGGATFTNVGGQSAYGWGAAMGTLYSASNAAAANRVLAANGDRIFVSSDHSESSTNNSYVFSNAGAFALIQIISVNRAGSVPPVAGDELSGATVTSTATQLTLDSQCNMYWQGVTISCPGVTGLIFNNGQVKFIYLKNCALVLGTGSGASIANNNPTKITWDNTTVQFGNAGQNIHFIAYAPDFTWINTPSAIGGTAPTTLISSASANYAAIMTLRGIDISAVTGTLLAASAGQNKVLLDSCRIASGLTRYGTPAAGGPTGDVLELVNCYDGTNVLNERYTPAGAVTTDRSTTLSGGATDDIGAYSLKLVSSTRSDRRTLTLDAFVLDVGLSAVGTSKTATVEIISSASLNDNDISVLLEYMGTSGSPIASFVSSISAAVTAGSALAASTATWNSPPGTPVAQKLSVTFTPQRAGRLRGLVRLGKPSTTVWVDPVIRIA